MHFMLGSDCHCGAVRLDCLHKYEVVYATQPTSLWESTSARGNWSNQNQMTRGWQFIYWSPYTRFVGETRTSFIGSLRPMCRSGLVVLCALCYRISSNRSPRPLLVQYVRPPACIRSPACIQGPACISTSTLRRTGGNIAETISTFVKRSVIGSDRQSEIRKPKYW